MPIDMFIKRKKDILAKTDKSFKKNIDEKIADLCQKINSLKDYYTTSSCSGRIVLMIDKEKKQRDLLIKLYHDLISFEKLKRDLNEIASFHSVINNKQLMKNPDVNNDLAEKSDEVDFGATKSRAKRGELIKFKMEPCALHIACRDLKNAKIFYDIGKLAGWKKSGIISSGKRFMVELISTERLEFPIIKKGKLLVDDEFLRIIVENANKKLKRCWDKIERLKNIIQQSLF